MRIFLFALPLLAVSLPAIAGDLAFEPNKGQSGPEVRYLARTAQGVLFLSDRDMILRRNGDVRFTLTGINRSAPFEPIGPATGDTSYFVGRDRTRWAQHVPSYARLARRGIYPGIDAIFYGSNGFLEYDFIVAPHADPSRIRLNVQGATRVFIDSAGDLIVEAPGGNVRQRKPEIYQTLANGERRRVEGSFRQFDSHSIGFKTEAYDHTLPLAIDPVILASTYLGGSGDDAVFASNGFTSVVMTSSADFPTSAAARRLHHNVAITNILAGNSNYRSTAVYGGSGDDVITAAYISPGSSSQQPASVIVAGYTDSKDLPTELSVSYINNQNTAWMIDYGGGASDGFVIATDGTLSPVTRQTSLFLSYFGGPGDDRINGIGFMGAYVALVGTTTQPAFPLPGPVATGAIGPGGGVDGFLAFSLLQTYYSFLISVSYFGGTGDDYPFGVTNTPNGLAMTGETSSSDFPFTSSLNGSLSGSSDAFVMIPQLESNFVMSGMTGTLFGGSGQDRGTSVVLSANNNLIAGGVTTSRDLPLASALQSAYGGGANDVFLAQFSPDLTKLVSSTYFGGSGTETLNALARDTFGSVYAAGSTSSTDFPLKNPLQPLYGGGPDDGFLLQLDLSGSLAYSTYLGGSGSDEILGLFPVSNMVTVAGKTSSPDFPAVSPAQAGLNGAANGFITQIGTHTLAFQGVQSGGLDLRATAYVVPGDITSYAFPRIAVTSSDPSTVVVAAQPSDPGAASTILNGNTLYFDCLTDHGTANITASAPGYPDATSQVTCYPVKAFLYVSPANVNGTEFSVSYGSTNPTSVFPQLYPAKPGASVNYYNLRPGATVAIQVTSSNTAVASFAQDSYGYANFPITLKGVGDTILTATASSAGGDPVTLHVTSPLAIVKSFSVPTGFSCPASSWSVNYTTSVATITSVNPDLLLLSSDPNTLGNASVTVPAYGNYPNATYLQAIGPAGSAAAVTVSMDGLDTVTIPVQITRAMAMLTMLRASTQVNTGDLIGFSTVVRPESLASNCLVNPGGPRTMTVVNTNSSVLKDVPATVPLTAIGSFNATVAAEGTSTISLQVPPGIVADPRTTSLTFTARTKTLSLSDIFLGNNLQSPMTLSLPYALSSSQAVTITSSNPALVLVTSDASKSGSAQVTLTASSGAKALSFTVQGLGSGGQVTITADAGPLGKTTAKVQLTPSGWAWSTDSFTTVRYATSSTSTTFGVYALDPATLVPLVPEGIRAGVAVPALTFDNTNPDVASASQSQPFGYVYIGILNSGAASLLLNTPPGFATPSRRTQFSIVVGMPSLSTSNSIIGKDQQQPFLVSAASYAYGVSLGTTTLTSSDPSKLLVSSSPLAVGSASAQGGSTFYLQALANSGSVTLTASAPGFLDSTATVTLGDSEISLLWDQYSNPPTGSYDQTAGLIVTTTQSAATRLTLLLGTGGGSSSQNSLRAGVPDVIVTFQSSNPAAGKVIESSARITAGASLPAVNFQPLAPGQTDISLIPPPGFVTLPLHTLKFKVTQPSFSVQPLTMAKDTIAPSSGQLLSTVRPLAANLTLTISSPDPSRLLLSPDPDTDPTPSITRVLIGGASYLPQFYLHAIGNNGTIPVKISASGFADTTLPVTLTDLAGSFYVSAPVQLVAQGGAVTAYVTISGQLRPGIAPIVVGIQSSDPSVVAIDTPQVVFTPGSASYSIPFMFHPVSPGSATISLVLPEGVVAQSPSINGPGASFLVTVTSSRLSIGNNSNLTIGRDGQAAVNIGAQAGFPNAVPLTITSSDPSKFLIADSAAASGQGSITVTTQNPQSQAIWVNALASSGSGSITVSAPGYIPASLPVMLVPSAAVFSTTSLTSPLNTTATVTVSLLQLDPTTLQPYSYGLITPRPGANLSISLKTSDPKIVQIPSGTISFGPSGSQTISLQPLALGTALLSLGTLSGGTSPSSGAQLVVNVTPAAISLPDFTLGYQEQVPVRFQIPDGMPTPVSSQYIYLSTSDPKLLLLSSNSAFGGSSQIGVAFPAGQRVSDQFWVQAYGQNGKPQIQAQFQNSTYITTVTLDRPAFVFKEANGSNTTLSETVSSAPLTLTLIPAVTADGLPLASPVLVPQATPIAINVVSSNTAVAAITGSPVTFGPNDTQKTIQVRLLGLGTATLTLSGDASSYLSTALSKITVVVK